MLRKATWIAAAATTNTLDGWGCVFLAGPAFDASSKRANVQDVLRGRPPGIYEP